MKLTEEQAYKLAAIVNSEISPIDGGYWGDFKITENAVIGVSGYSPAIEENGPQLFVIEKKDIDESFNDWSWKWEEAGDDEEEITPKQAYEYVYEDIVGADVGWFLDSSNHL